MQNPSACLSPPSLTAAPGSVLGLDHISPSARYEPNSAGIGSSVSSFDQHSRSYSDPRYHQSAYHNNTLPADRLNHVTYETHGYQNQDLHSGYNGFSEQSGGRNGAVYRNDGQTDTGFKAYSGCWTNGNSADYQQSQQQHPPVAQHLPLTGPQSGYSATSNNSGGNICHTVAASRVSPSHPSPVLPVHNSSPAASWSTRTTTPSPHVSSPAGRNRSPASPFLSPSPLQSAGAAVVPNGVSVSSQAASHPLHSLQQMVDPDSSNSSASFDPSSNRTPPTSVNKMQSAPTCYPTGDQGVSGGSSSGNLYPTYYNMDQNRLCSDQEVSVQRGERGVGNSHQQEKQVRNGITNEITADGRVLPQHQQQQQSQPQPKHLNQKTPYFPLNTNCVTPDTHTLVNGTGVTQTVTTSAPSSSSWNGTQDWNGISSGPSAHWPTNGLPVTTSSAPNSLYPNTQPAPSLPQPFPVPAVDQTASTTASLSQQNSGSSSWSTSDGTQSGQSLPGGAPAATPPVQKKKRGRPFGSKNKPKNPALLAAATPPVTAGRKKPGRKPKAAVLGSDTPSHTAVATMASGDMRVLPAVTSEDGVSGTTGAVARNKKNAGPYIRVDKDQGLAVYTITNCAVSAANAKDSGLAARPAHLLSRPRHEVIASKQRMTSSAPMTSSFAPDSNGPWICVFCKQGPHHEGLGDLFGPYFVPAHHSPPHSLTPDDSPHKATGKKRKLDPDNGTIISNNNGDNNQTDVQQEEVWFHEDCISWSSGVYLVGHSIRNMEEIVRDSADSMCSSCGLSGANMGCVFGGCHQRYHFLCARTSSCDFNEDNYSILCQRHKDKLQKRTENTDNFLSPTIF